VLRATGHDVTAIAEISPRASDEIVLALARGEARILLTEDRDFGLLAYAGGHETAGVVLIRLPGNARGSLEQAIRDVVAEFGDRLGTGFVVVEPGRARLSRRDAGV
jgi:predicted nuclease of predicted toxin-antitoxin system